MSWTQETQTWICRSMRSVCEMSESPPQLAHEGCTGRNTSVSTLGRSSAGYWQQDWWHGVAWARTKAEGMAWDKGAWTATRPTPASVCTHRHPGPLSTPLQHQHASTQPWLSQPLWAHTWFVQAFPLSFVSLYLLLMQGSNWKLK